MPAMFLPLCSDISWSIFAVSDMFGDGCSAKDHFEMRMLRGTGRRIVIQI